MTSQTQLSCIIIGTTSLTIQCGTIWLEQGHTIAAIVSKEEAIVEWAHQQNIPHYRTLTTFTERPIVDYLFSIVNPFILTDDILALPRQFAINYHDSPLPRYAGVHATNWAILNQETTHAVTWHRIVAEVDAGDILQQQAVPVTADETALTLNAKCYAAAIDTFRKAVTDLASGQPTLTPQDLTQRTYYGLYKRPACLLDWSQPAADLEALTRALYFGPYPNPLGLPQFLLGETALAARKLTVLDHPSAAAAGTVLAVEADRLVVATATNDVAVSELSTLTGESVDLPALVEAAGSDVGSRLPIPAAEMPQRLAQLREQLARQERFWVTRLRKAQPLRLPYLQQTAHVTDHPLVIQTAPPSEMTGTALLLASLLFLARFTDTYRYDVAFRHPQLTQTVSEFEGLFAGYVPLSVDLSADLTYAEAETELRGQIEPLFNRATYPLDTIARHAETQTDFPIVVEQLSDVEAGAYVPHSSVTLLLSTDGQRLRWLFNPQMLDEQDAVRLSGHFDTFLSRVAADKPLWQQPILNFAEQHQLLIDWNSTAADYPQDKCLHHLIEAQVAQHPDMVAVVYEGQRLTYANLNQQANQVAHYLQAGLDFRDAETDGVRQPIVGIFMEPSLEMMVGILATLKAGAAYLPLDPTYPAERLAFMLQDADVSIVLTQAHLTDRRPPHQGAWLQLDQDWSLVAEYPTNNPTSTVTADDWAYLIYTSGSTGRPKGVCCRHRGAINTTMNAQTRCPMGVGARHSLWTSISFDVSVSEIFPALMFAGTLYLPTEETRFDAAQFVAWLAEQHIETASPASFMLETFAAWAEANPGKLALRRLMVGTEPIPEPLLYRLTQLIPDLYIANCYGPTETSIDATFYEIDPTTPPPVGNAPIGRPVQNSTLYLFDSHKQVVPVGVLGEIHIGGAGLAAGYLNRPDLTAERFIAPPASITALPLPDAHPAITSPDKRLYKTGDLARYLPDGNIQFVGRADYQVKLRNFRVELGEIEAVLMQHEAVQQAVVLLREDRPGDKQLVAYLLAAESETLIPDLRANMQQQLPAYMRPTAFITLDKFPLTPNDKVDRQALPAPQETDYQTGRTFVEPIGETEQRLAEIWADLLPVKRVGRTDDFFELGGHSLLATKIINLLQETFRVSIPLRTIFEYPTIADIAEYVDALRWTHQNTILDTDGLQEEGVI